jgi:hypothetical protein
MKQAQQFSQARPLLHHPSLAISTTQKYQNSPKQPSSPHQPYIKISNRPSVKQALLHWINHGNFPLKISYPQLNKEMFNELSLHLPPSFHHLLSLLKNDLLRINLTHHTLYISDTQKHNSVIRQEIKREALFHILYKNTVRCYGGWISPLGNLSIIDHLIHAISSIKLQSILKNPQLRKQLRSAFSHRNKELTHYINAHQLSFHSTQMKLLIQIIEKQHQPHALFARHIRIESETKLPHPELSLYVTRFNHYYGKENGHFKQHICLNNHCKMEYVFSRRPLNIRAVLHELFLDAEIFYQKSHLPFQLEQPNLMSSALSNYLSFCSKWGNDICEVMAPKPYQFITQLSNVAATEAHTYEWPIIITTLGALLFFIRSFFSSQNKTRLPHKQSHKNLNTKRKKKPTSIQKKITPLFINSPPRKEKLQHHTEPLSTEPLRKKKGRRQLRLNKKQKATLKIQALIHERNKQRRQKSPQKKTIRHKPKLSKIIHHTDCYTNTTIQNIPSNGQETLIKLFTLSESLHNKLYIKGSNAIHPEINPVDIDLQLFCSNDICKMYHQIESQFPTEQIIIKLYASDLISFQLNIRAAPPFDITLSSSNEESFLFQDLSLSTCSGLRHIIINGKKISYGSLILPVSNQNLTKHKQSQKQIIDLIENKKLKLLHNTYRNTQELIQSGNILLVTQNFTHIFKQTLKLNCLPKTDIQIIKILTQLAQRILANKDIRVKQSNFIRQKVKHYINIIPSFLLQIEQSDLKKISHLHYFISLANKIHHEQFELPNKKTNPQDNTYDTGPTPTITHS